MKQSAVSIQNLSEQVHAPWDRTVKYIPEEFSRDGFLVEKKLFDAIASLCKNDPVSVWLLR